MEIGESASELTKRKGREYRATAKLKREKMPEDQKAQLLAKDKEYQTLYHKRAYARKIFTDPRPEEEMFQKLLEKKAREKNIQKIQEEEQFFKGLSDALGSELLENEKQREHYLSTIQKRRKNEELKEQKQQKKLELLKDPNHIMRSDYTKLSHMSEEEKRERILLRSKKGNHTRKTKKSENEALEDQPLDNVDPFLQDLYADSDGADFDDVNLDRNDSDGADSDGADFDGADFDADFDGADFDGADFDADFDVGLGPKKTKKKRQYKPTKKRQYKPTKRRQNKSTKRRQNK